MNESPTTAQPANPLLKIEFLVLRFDPRDASLAVVGDRGYSASNHADAVRDARQAAADSAAEGLPVQHLVIRLATEKTFDAA